MSVNCKDRVGIIFGGRSKEHEVSCISAASVITAIDKDKHHIELIGITKEGDFKHLKFRDVNEELVQSLKSGAWVNEAENFNPWELKDMVDFVLPIVHGPYCEDGKLQGFIEILDKPYGGCGVLASALAMDKVMCKDIFIKTGLPTCKYVLVTDAMIEDNPNKVLDKIQDNLGFPAFVKPANLGSSVGISKVIDKEQLLDAIKFSLQFDRRVIVEEFIHARELETGVIGNEKPEVSVVGEILTDAEFYDYEAKYISVSGLKLSIPADISEVKSEEIRRLAIKAYKAIDGEGFSRVDFFMEKATEKIYINEINTIPGFTKYSMFPLLWEASGVPFKESIERIIGLGYERYNAKNNR